MRGLEKITDGGQIYALVLRRYFSRSGIHFFTPGEFSQQLAFLIHKKGKIIERHRHKMVKREVWRTQEVLVLLEGRLKVIVFNEKGRKLKTVFLKPGDTILLARGGHSVKILDNSKIVEVKQGPYIGGDDKEFY